MSHVKHNYVNYHFIPKHNCPFNTFVVHSSISCVQRKLMTFVYLYPLESGSILSPLNLPIPINTPTTSAKRANSTVCLIVE